jgi:hypothetical protein
MLWDWDGTLERIHHALYVAVREQAGREACFGRVRGQARLSPLELARPANHSPD